MPRATAWQRLLCAVLVLALLLAPGCCSAYHDPAETHAAQVVWGVTVPFAAILDVAFLPAFLILLPSDLPRWLFAYTRMAISGAHCYEIDRTTELPRFPLLPGKPPRSR